MQCSPRKARISGPGTPARSGYSAPAFSPAPGVAQALGACAGLSPMQCSPRKARISGPGRGGDPRRFISPGAHVGSGARARAFSPETARAQAMGACGAGFTPPQIHGSGARARAFSPETARAQAMGACGAGFNPPQIQSQPPAIAGRTYGSEMPDQWSSAARAFSPLPAHAQAMGAGAGISPPQVQSQPPAFAGRMYGSSTLSQWSASPDRVHGSSLVSQPPAFAGRTYGSSTLSQPPALAGCTFGASGQSPHEQISVRGLEHDGHRLYLSIQVCLVTRTCAACSQCSRS